MTLRTRFILVMLLCGLGPLVGAGVLARAVLARRYEQADAQRREAVIARVERALGQRATAQNRALKRVCAHDPVIDRAVLQLARGEFTSEAREGIGELLPEVMGSLGFDVLVVLAADGETLASAHYRGQSGVRDPVTARLARQARGDERWVRRVRVRGGSEGPHDILVLQSFCTRRHENTLIAVAGGQSIEDLVQDLGREEGVSTRIVEGAAIGDGRAEIQRVLSLRSPTGDTVASVVVSTSDRPLKDLQSELDALTAAAAVVASLTAVLLAVLLAPPLARPIGEVADAADRIAQGDRSVHIGVKAGGEVGRLVAAFNHMTRELDAAEARIRRAERVAAWREIARQMAHEIKNPLTPIRMAVEMLRKAQERRMEDFDALFDEQTLIVLEEVERLRRLVKDFSDFARAPRPRPEVVALSEVISHVVELHAGGGATVTSVCDERVPDIRADRDQLTQVLVNLVANGAFAAEERAAREASGEAPRVTLSLTVGAEGFVHLAVRDNGGGIPEEVRERLFEPYVTNKQGGTGLGLPTAQRIVLDHGGSITASSSAKGTSFDIELPVAGPVGDLTKAG